MKRKKRQNDFRFLVVNERGVKKKKGREWSRRDFQIWFFVFFSSSSLVLFNQCSKERRMIMMKDGWQSRLKLPRKRRFRYFLLLLPLILFFCISFKHEEQRSSSFSSSRLVTVVILNEVDDGRQHAVPKVTTLNANRLCIKLNVCLLSSLRRIIRRKRRRQINETQWYRAKRVADLFFQF